MKKQFIVIVMLILLLTACGNQNAVEEQGNIQSPVIAQKETPKDEAAVTKETNPERSTSSLVSPTYLDESKYQGEELEIIKLINLRIQYLWEGNEESYMKLIYEQSPLINFPAYKLEKASLRSDISFKEQSKIIQAVIGVEEVRLGEDEERNYVYVFSKRKEEGAKWGYQDID